MVRVLAKPSFQSHWAVVRDVSIRGMGLVMSGPLEPGTVLAVQLQRKHTGVSGILSAKVIYCFQQPDRTWRVGCWLGRNLTEDELSMLP